MEDAEVAGWLKALPLAPEYHPTEVEFSDPVAYVLKIEAEARQYGICKIVPPFSKASKESAIHNLNSALVSNGRSNGSSETDSIAKFTTRRQQLGKSRRHKGVLAERLLWQSGESYTIDQFEVKASAFSKAHLGTCKDVPPLCLESLFWKAVEDKRVSVEYADDIQGSAFAEPSALQNRKRKRQNNNDQENSLMEMNEQIVCKSDYPGEMKVCLDDAGKYHRRACLTLTEDDHLHADECDTDCIPGWKLANSSWNMRYVARSPGSLLQFMPHEIPGVTSPMVYIGMLFSCVAWHVEDHELHSLDYLHLGAPKTWYAVPPDAALALQEVARMYGGNIDPQAAFALLGEKTTIMSPEVLVGAGVPCCRLVQNAGEYVVTFPSAYHLGFSHGFNCGETANFATPEWLDILKEAATRRVALKRLPTLSHQLLLYRLATSVPPQFPSSTCSELESSSLNEKSRHQDEEIIKIKFVNDALSNNHSLKNLSKLGIHICLMLEGTFSMQHSKALSSQKSSKATIASIDSIHLDAEPTPNQSLTSRKDTFDSYKCENLGCGQENLACTICRTPANLLQCSHPDSRKTAESYLDWGTLPCAACGVLCFTTICIVQPIMQTYNKFEKNLADQQRQPTASNGAYDHKVGLSFCEPTGDINTATQSGSLCKQTPELEQTQITMELAPSCCSIALDVKDGVAENSDTMEKQNTENKNTSIPTPFNEACYDTKNKSYAELGPECTCSERTKPLLESVDEVKVEFNQKDKGSSKCKLDFPNYNTDSEASNILHEHEHELVKSITVEALSASQAPNAGPTEGEPNNFLLERSMSTSMLTSLELLVATYNDDSDVDNQTCNDSVGPNEIMERGLKDQVSTSLDALWSQPCLLGIGEERNLASEYNKFSCGSVAGFMTFIQENTCSSELSDMCESYIGAAQSAGENNMADNILANSRKFEDQKFLEPCNDRCDNEDTFNRGEFMQTNEDAAGGNAVGGTVCPAKNDMGSISESTKLENSILCSKLGARPRILCLDHALEVKEKSRQNGVHLLVVCHADFLQFEARAKAMAKEMNLGKDWEEIPFRKPDHDELQIIAAAIGSRIDHIHANNDWVLDVSLKDGKNHPDSEDRHSVPGNTNANIASPKYTIDTTQVEHFKEEIVGKWCGSIWRADQVHSLLGGCKDVSNTWGTLMTDADSPVIDKSAPEESPEPNNVQTYHCTNEQGSPKGSNHQNIASSAASLPRDEDLDVEHKDAHKHMPVHEYKDFDDGGEEHAVALTQTIRGRKRKGFGRKRKLLPKFKRRSPEEKPECWSIANEKAGICSTDLMTENRYIDNAGSLDCTCSMELCNHCRTAAVMLRLKLDSPHQESFGMVSVCADQESSLSTGKSGERFPCISDTSEKLLHELPEVEIGHDLIQCKSGTKLLSATAVLSAKDKQGIRKSLLHLSGLEQAQNEDCGSLPVTGYKNSEADMQSVWHDVPILCSASLYSEFSYIGQYIERMSESVYPFADISESFIPYHKNRMSYAKIQQGSDGVCAVGDNRHNASGGTSNNYGTKPQQPDAQNKQGLIMGMKRKRQNPTLDDVSFKKVALPAEDRLQYSQGQGFAMPHVNQKIEETLGSGCKLETTKNSPDLRNIACKIESDMEVDEAFDPHKQSGCLSMPSIPSIEEHGGDSEPFSVDSLGSVLPIISSPEKKSATRSKRMRSPGWTGLLQQKSECDIQKIETTELTENSEGGASEKKHEKWIKLSDCGKGSTIGPVTRLRAKFPLSEGASEKPTKAACNRTKRRSHKLANPIDGDEGEESYTCSIDGCYMKFVAQKDLLLHKRNICTYQSCGKQLCSHSYLLQHFRVHVDDRPLKCPWKGCTKTFKWAWARTEHIRVHTGERPYVCKECGKRYRFVSDFSRHKRNTGHAS